MWKQFATAITLAIPLVTATIPVCGQETSDSSSYASPRRAVPDVWPSFTMPAVREDWFNFKAEVDADKGLSVSESAVLHICGGLPTLSTPHSVGKMSEEQH